MWHVQDLTSSDTALTLERGLGRGLGVLALVPFRHVRARVDFEDAARRPLPPGTQDIHHRDETLVGLGDPTLLVVAGGAAAGWSVMGRIGVSVPLGRTEPNPFALGREGRTHQHLQFGTGTWDPVVGVAAGRRLGPAAVTATVFARFPGGENGHGYRAGRRLHASLLADQRIRGSWRGHLGMDVAWEAAERWDGRVEEEGNLGRTDVLASLGIARSLAGGGALTATLKLPLAVRARGSQLDYPLVVVLGWTR